MKKALKRSRSSQLTGGEGFTYEDAVVAYYLAALLREELAQGARGKVVKVSVQRERQGEPLDDLIVDAEEFGEVSRLSLQVKHSLTISASDKDLKAIIAGAVATRAKTEFQTGRDRYGFVTDDVALRGFNALSRILELAEASTTGADFAARFKPSGEASKVVMDLRNKLRPLIAPANDDAELDFYKHFVAYRFDNLQPGGDRFVQLCSRLDEVTASGGAALAEILCRQVRLGEGRGKIWARNTLFADLRGVVQLRSAPTYRADVEALRSLARDTCAAIRADIAGFSLDRTKLVEMAEREAAEHVFTNIWGLPGCGKSVILRYCVERAMARGPVLFLKADNLEGTSWRSYAKSQGLQHLEPFELLGEIGAAGTATLFIDGIDRVNPAHRRVIGDLLHAIQREPGLQNWRVLATSRDQGLEVLRSWIPPSLYSAKGLGNVEVETLDDDEATLLGGHHTSLQPLLFGAEAVKEIARRPFFAAVLADQAAAIGFDKIPAPQTEAELIAAWWRAGGYNVEPTAADSRQRSLLDLAACGAPNLGKKIRGRQIKSETAGQLEGLRRDKIVDAVIDGTEYKFAHDIFFEWAFFRLLIDEGDAWPEALVKAGEPPLLVRIVGLLAQSEYEKHGPWAVGFNLLSARELRPQWRRAWLLGPAASPQFANNIAEFDRLLAADDFALLEKFLVWFQAERTIPSLLVLQNGAGQMDGSFLIRAADMLGWPANVPEWQRVLKWIFEKHATFPVRLIPHVVELFAVWQNIWANFRNPISAQILTLCETWLIELETGDTERWKELKDGIAGKLRSMLLMAVRAYPDSAGRVLDRVASWERRPEPVLDGIFSLSTILAPVFADKLADLVRIEVIEELPRDKKERREREEEEYFARLKATREKPEDQRTPAEQRMIDSPSMFYSFGRDELRFDEIGIDNHHSSFFPVAPGHEPFDALFQIVPDVARKLVRDLSNHATQGWLQVHEMDKERHGTPLPLEIEFPWGTQTFWGDGRTYGWYFGIGGPQPLECALAAMTYWAHRQLEAGTPVEDLIRLVVEGQQSIAALGLAVSLAIESGGRSPAVLSLLRSQRLWVLDLSRQVQEGGRGINFFGLDPRDRMTVKQRAGDEYLLGRRYRQHSLKDLAYLYALGTDEAEREGFIADLGRFAQELPYEVAEQIGNEQFEAKARERAAAWAEFAKQENYALAHSGDENSPAQLIYTDPTPKTPERQERQEENTKSLQDFTVFGWASESLRKNEVQAPVSLKAALKFARQRDASDLFDEVAEAGSGMRQAGVAAVAAMVFRFGAEPEDVEWAWTVVDRIDGIKEEEAPFRYTKNPADPRPFYIAALHDDLRSAAPRTSSVTRLLTVANDPNPNIADMAFGALLNSGAMAEHVTWNAAILASELFMIHVSRGQDDTLKSQDQQYRQAALVRALERASGEEAVPATLVSPPAPWVKVSEHAGRGQRRSRDSEIWTYPNFDFNAQRAAKILRLFAVEKWAEDADKRRELLRYTAELVKWTAERIFPSFDEKYDDRPSGLYEWIQALAGFTARVAALVPADHAWRDFVEPFAVRRQRDIWQFLAELTDSLICRYVYDASEIPRSVTKLLEMLVSLMLARREFSPNAYRAGEIGDRHIDKMIQAFLFVSVKDAPGASRFANGDWSDLPKVMPQIEQLVTAAGWTDGVMMHFLILCERAGGNMPIPVFSRLVIGSMDAEGFRFERWKSSDIPARISGVIQQLADANHPLQQEDATQLLLILDRLVDMGDRRAAALQQSEHFRGIQLTSKSAD